MNEYPESDRESALDYQHTVLKELHGALQDVRLRISRIRNELHSEPPKPEADCVEKSNPNPAGKIPRNSVMIHDCLLRVEEIHKEIDKLHGIL